MEPTLNPARRPDKVTLHGRYATIVPIAPEHADAIYTATAESANDHLWDYMGEGPFFDRDGFDAAWQRKIASADAVFYSVLDANSQAPVGYASLMRIDPANACIEVGNIMYSPALQRTPAATEAQYLLARYVFEDLGNVFREAPAAGRFLAHVLFLLKSRLVELILGFSFLPV